MKTIHCIGSKWLLVDMHVVLNVLEKFALYPGMLQGQKWGYLYVFNSITYTQVAWSVIQFSVDCRIWEICVKPSFSVVLFSFKFNFVDINRRQTTIHHVLVESDTLYIHCLRPWSTAFIDCEMLIYQSNGYFKTLLQPIFCSGTILVDMGQKTVNKYEISTTIGLEGA